MKCPHCKLRDATVSGTAGKGRGSIYGCGCGWRGYDPSENHLRDAVDKANGWGFYMKGVDDERQE